MPVSEPSPIQKSSHPTTRFFAILYGVPLRRLGRQDTLRFLYRFSYAGEKREFVRGQRDLTVLLVLQEAHTAPVPGGVLARRVELGACPGLDAQPLRLGEVLRTQRIARSNGRTTGPSIAKVIRVRYHHLSSQSNMTLNKGEFLRERMRMISQI